MINNLFVARLSLVLSDKISVKPYEVNDNIIWRNCMNPTALALSGYITWFLVLLSSIVLMRVHLTLSGKRRANSFSPTGEDVSDFSARLCRTHANCYEAMPYIGGLLIVALATDNTHITDSLALPLMIARFLQSVVHLISTKNLAVMARFTFLTIQIIICFYWSIMFLHKFTG